jgi:hypothetical protein
LDAEVELLDAVVLLIDEVVDAVRAAEAPLAELLVAEELAVEAAYVLYRGAVEDLHLQEAVDIGNFIV